MEWLTHRSKCKIYHSEPKNFVLFTRWTFSPEMNCDEVKKAQTEGISFVIHPPGICTFTIWLSEASAKIMYQGKKQNTKPSSSME